MRTCDECANFRPSTARCAEYGKCVDSDATCGRFVALDGSTVPKDFKPFLTRRIAPEEPEVAKKPKPLGRDRVVELVLAGKKQADIAREYGVHTSTVAIHLRRAVEEGEIVKLGRGEYAPPGMPVPEKLIAETTSGQKWSVSAGEAAADDKRLEAISEGVDEVRWATAEQAMAIEQLRVAVMELRAEIAELRAMVQAGKGGSDDKALVDRLLTMLEAQLGVRGGAA